MPGSVYHMFICHITCSKCKICRIIKLCLFLAYFTYNKLTFFPYISVSFGFNLVWFNDAIIAMNVNKLRSSSRGGKSNEAYEELGFSYRNLVILSGRTDKTAVCIYHKKLAFVAMQNYFTS
jgi:hypothetical protein